MTKTMKLYRVVDATKLELVRSWCMGIHNKSHLIQEGDSWLVTVDDPIGVTPLTPVFEAEFAGIVENIAWPK